MEGFDTYRILADEIGEEVAQQIFEVFAGHTINFSKKVSLFFRDTEIIERFDKGETYEKLARAYQLSPRHVRNITSRVYRRRTIKRQKELLQICEIFPKTSAMRLLKNTPHKGAYS